MNPQRNAGPSAGITMEKLQADTCVQCGAAIDADTKFCPSCGTPVAEAQGLSTAPDASTAVCSRCREANPVGSKFCRGCGNALSAPAEEADVTPPASTQQVPVPAASAEPSPPLANPAVGRASAPGKRTPVAVVAIVVAVIAAGAGAAITLVAKGSGHGSLPVGTPLTNAAPAGTAASTSPSPAQAKEVARTAETTAETLATDNNGSYASITPQKLNEVEPTLAVCPTSAAGACLSAATGTETSYAVTAKMVPSGDEFTIERKGNGEILRTCVVGQANAESCSNGTW